MLDIDGDGSPEIVGGGQDGFLYVLGADGAFRFSQSFGAAITRLQPLPDARLAVGLRTGDVILAAGPDLTPAARAQIGDRPVRHLALTTDGLIAADNNGRAVVIDVAAQ